MLKSLLYRPARRLLMTIAPGRYAELREAWVHHIRFLSIEAIHAIVADGGLRVRSGPFKGLMFLPLGIEGSAAARLLGTYEMELREDIERLIGRGHTKVINIGCGDGYYAVGLALRMPGARVIGFDIDPFQSRICAATAEINGAADRVEVRGECSTADLTRETGERALVVCDCEGAELDLLRPDEAPGLAACDLLVELHDLVRPGLSAELLARFESTHEIRIIDAVAREAARHAGLDFLTPDQRSRALQEFRGGPQQWAVLTAKADAEPVAGPNPERGA